MWGATTGAFSPGGEWRISIHAPRVGSDPDDIKTARRAHKYFNPRSPCGERPVPVGLVSVRGIISIHAPRVGSDPPVDGFVLPAGHISIHAPRVGSDSIKIGRDCTGRHFNPRSPCGERRPNSSDDPRPEYFNPRSPCGERPTVTQQPRGTSTFQSTLPVWGATANGIKVFLIVEFQSTLPVWGATSAQIASRDIPKNFNPRSPCGERRRAGCIPEDRHDFNPRSPCGERPVQH